MTREEEIIEASQLYAKAQQKPFMDGAMWADKHPTEEVQRLKRMFESDPDAYAQGYKNAIEKAVEWIKQFAYNSVVTDHIGEREKQAIIITFKEAMEEENKESP